MTHIATITRRNRTLGVMWWDGEGCFAGTVRQCLATIPPDADGIRWVVMIRGVCRGPLRVHGYANPTHGFEDLLSGADSITVEWEE